METEEEVHLYCETQFKGFKFLANLKPNKYIIYEKTFMEGMTVVYSLWDNYAKLRLGPRLHYSNVGQSWIGVEVETDDIIQRMIK